jgi:hypothetical protein
VRDARAQGGRARIRRAVFVAWSATCVAILLVLVGGRWLRYTSWSAAPALDRALRELMVVEQQAFLWPWVYSSLKARTVLLAAAVVVVGLHRRLLGRLVHRVDGVWHGTPIAVSLLLGGMVWLQWLFDVNPTVALVCAASLVLAWATRLPRVARAVPAIVVVAAWIALFAWALVTAGDAADRLAIGVWALVLATTERLLAPRVGRRDLTLLRVAAVMPVNLLPAILPIVVPLHGGMLFGRGLAYSFCERPDGRRLYAAVPVCGSVDAGYEGCRDGSVVEYDLPTLTPVATHRFFSPTFYGRLELLTCLEDEVQVAIQALVYQGRNVVQGVLSFPPEAPEKFTVLTADAGIGTTIAYDRAHDAFYYSGEFSNPVVRFDRRTKEFDDGPSRDFPRRWVEPVALKVNSGSLCLFTGSIHPGRDRLYIADWMQGRQAHALDLSTRRVVARYDVGGGGSMGIAVDPERDRLYVSSVWGLEVVDLATDRIVARKRMGVGNRPVIVDAARNRLYVSSMVEGKIRILDRDTLDVVGQIPVGFGSRYALLTADGRRLFASSTAGQYWWDADALAR